MKKTIIILTTLVTLIACSKKDTLPSQDATLAKIINSWKFDSSMNLVYKNNILVPKDSDTTRGAANDYLDFRLDGKLYINIIANAPKSKDTEVYAFINNKLLMQDLNGGDLLYFNINELTDHRLTIEAKDDFGTPGNYEKIIITAEK